MSVSTSTSSVSYVGNNSTTTAYVVPYAFFDATDLKIYLVDASGASTLLTITTQYTVSGGAGTTGLVTTTSAIPSTSTVIIARSVPYTQLTSFTTGDRLPAASIEKALDKLTMETQQLSRVVPPDTAATSAGSLPQHLSINTAAGAAVWQPIATNEIATAMIQNAAVTTAKIADAAVTSAKIADGSIATADLADGAVTSAKIADGTIATTDLSDSAVTTAKIADGSITSAKIADGTVIAADIADGSVTTGKIADAGVLPIKIGGNPSSGSYVLGSSAGSVMWVTPSTASLADGSVITTKLADAAVTSAKIADGAIVTASLANGAVTTSKLADSSVTSAKIVDGSIATADLADGTVTSAKLADVSVTSAKIADGAIVTASLANGAVTTSKLADSSVTSAKIVDGSIATADLADGAITPAKLSTGGPSWDTSGNVGIGTSTPIRKLHLSQAASVEQVWEQTDALANYRKYNAVVSGGSSGVGASYVFRILNDLGNAATKNIYSISPDGKIDAQGNPITSCKTTAKAWVNFRGLATTGTVTVTDQYNILSMASLGQGVYNINFLNTLGTNTYAVVGGTATSGCVVISVNNTAVTAAPTTKSATQLQIQTSSSTGPYNPYEAYVAIFGT